MSDNSFNTILAKEPVRNPFSLNHSYTTPINIGELTPIEIRECIPGDSWRYSENHVLKSAPMPSPVMNEFDYYVHYFFVPYRLLTKSEIFSTGDSLIDWRTPKLVRGSDDYTTLSTNLFALDRSLSEKAKGVARTLAALGYGELDVLEHGGVADEYRPVNSFAFDAYLKIYNDYYRNQFTQDEIPLVSSDEYQNAVNASPLDEWYDDIRLSDSSAFTHGNLLCRNFKKDLFTTLLPDPVLYGQDIVLSLQGIDRLYGRQDSEINLNVLNDVHISTQSQSDIETPSLFLKGPVGTATDLYHTKQTPTSTPVGDTPFYSLGFEIQTKNPDTFDLDHSSLSFGNKYIFNDVAVEGATLGTINELRTAFKLQEFLEKSITGGDRYIEQIYNHFGVKSSDARLQRPELIGYGSAPISITQINATNASAEAQTLGSMSGHAVSFGSSEPFDYYCEEYGLIIGLASIMPKNYYKITGMQKQYTRDVRLDFYWPEFSHIGMQEVRVCEFVGGSNVRRSVELSEVVGYQDVYSEYKFAPSTVSRLMPSGLESWVWWNDFQTLADIECIPQDFQSIFSVSGTSEFDYQFILHSHQYIDVSRYMPTFGTPML